MALFNLAGIDSTDKVPMVAAESRHGQGKSSGTALWLVVCTGNMTADGSMVADQDVQQVFAADEVAALVGRRSESAQQAREAIAVGAAVVLAPVAEAAGAVAASLVLSCEALGTGSGQVWLQLGDKRVSWVVDTESLITTMVAAAAAINAVPDLFCSVTSIPAGPDYDVTIT